MRTVFIDVETGGTDPAVHPIIQFAAVVVGPSLEEIEALEIKLLFDPAECDSEALAKNRYDAATWEREAVPAYVAVRDVGELFRRYADVEKISQRGRPYSVARLGAHNARFDCDFVAALFKAFGAFCPAAIYEPLDTLALARWYSATQANPPANHQLETLCAWLGRGLLDAHDALADCRACLFVARELCGRMGLVLR